MTHGTSWGGQGARHLPPGGSEAEKSNLMFSLEILGVGGQGEAADDLARA